MIGVVECACSLLFLGSCVMIHVLSSVFVACCCFLFLVWRLRFDVCCMLVECRCLLFVVCWCLAFVV